MIEAARYLELGPDFYAEVMPQALRNPRLHVHDAATARACGLSEFELSFNPWLALFSGQQVPAHCRPLAQVYAGHQMGKFNPSLGDGRVLLLGEIDHAGRRRELSIKGAGPTPYSRHADGVAGLSECLQEFDLSRTVRAAGIPVVDCLCVISGEEQVDRKGFERRAILVRSAPSLLRFGTFEHFYAQGEHANSQRLADYLLRWHFPECAAQAQPFAALFTEIVRRTAILIGLWQLNGFTHGMLNTDNQSLLGLTLDLGESSFNPTRAPDYVSSPRDKQARYAFGNQPAVGLWNCNALARAMSPLIEQTQLKQALQLYEPQLLAITGS